MITSILSGTTPNGSLITILQGEASLETTSIDLNVGLVELEQSSCETQSFDFEKDESASEFICQSSSRPRNPTMKRQRSTSRRASKCFLLSLPESWTTNCNMVSNNHIPSDQRLSVCGKCTGNCNRCSCGKNKLVCTLLCKCLTKKCQNRQPVSSSQNFNVNQIPMKDAGFDDNQNESSCDLNAIDSVDVEDEEISRRTYSSSSNYVSDTESSSCDFSQLYQSSYQSISSIVEDDNIDNDNLSIINIDNDCSNRSWEKSTENSIVFKKSQRTIHKTISELGAGLSNTKRIIQSQKINSFSIRSQSSFNLPLSPRSINLCRTRPFSHSLRPFGRRNVRPGSPLSFSQPVTSTPQITKGNTRRVMKKQNYHAHDKNISSISFSQSQDHEE
ncbi:unnamed protein product [Rotaria magnacalcarata]|uniref:Uncharacterized protein n=1 Tax=Rotaria magnacalcarata TaxID=392030 RepID=A0A819KZR6_9BILA|nr:unnamed protein product [Rotaria magnacalcarata]